MAMTEDEAREAVRSLRAAGARWSDVTVAVRVDLREFVDPTRSKDA